MSSVRLNFSITHKTKQLSSKNNESYWRSEGLAEEIIDDILFCLRLLSHHSNERLRAMNWEIMSVGLGGLSIAAAAALLIPADFILASLGAIGYYGQKMSEHEKHEGEKKY